MRSRLGIIGWGGGWGESGLREVAGLAEEVPYGKQRFWGQTAKGTAGTG